MSLYHETAEILSQPSSTGGNLKTRIFSNKSLKAPQQQIYALALESCKWSAVLKEVIEAADLLRHERKLSPVLALLLVHDFLISKGGIALPATHGLRASIERHKARLSSELTRARIRRRAASLEQLRDQVTAEYLEATGAYPRWVRVNTIRSTLEDQLDTTFKSFNRVQTIKEVTSTPGRNLYLDAHVPNLVAISPAFEVHKTDAYKNGEIILQDKASCFPAYLLDPLMGDVIDSCSAPGNKTTHVAAIVNSRVAEGEECIQKVFAFEKDKYRSRTLEKMVRIAGGDGIVRMSFGQDFLKVDPFSPLYNNVTCLLLDPSCSGSGIVGRDSMPTVHLPQSPNGTASKNNSKPSSKPQNTPPSTGNNKKRKREEKTDRISTKEAAAQQEVEQRTMVDDDGKETVISSEQELQKRLESLSGFQLVLILHALEFPAARRVTYSTCSVHREENEDVVHKVLQSEVARRRGWRVMRRDEQVMGMREWPVRGVETGNASGSGRGDTDKIIADACIRSYKDDGHGVMGFFVAGFVRDEDGGEAEAASLDDGPYVRDDNGRIVRDMAGMPTLKSSEATTQELPTRGANGENKPPSSKAANADQANESSSEDSSDGSDSDTNEEEGDGEDEEEWTGFD
ncbi:NOL1/NOP2/sun domain protein [Microdochium trichocladiopsis]|uniref:NOL1/NOP2/sun domain protein n=1 Tax=Microdochium trichocladiopsis TaxID=1682393 RepID=A0A9P9C0P7_9PEZI|nr:NOL1/NOP2/sun domain protein [Microdochium trichocladiopsis]KAH7041324.1 NOL1/NOP2/sun domain protein [Microdochium trichocladiopsis]